MIIGTGIDLIELDRIEKLLYKKKFIERILTKMEQEAFYNKGSEQRKKEFLAGRFAAKEAYAKATGLGIGQYLSWQDIEILNDGTGKPIINVKADHRIHLSITHTKKYAAATVTIESLSG
ncbi:holo-[acyl-carrier protein] synthase [Pullulanibacillus pueri]|uniref:Holo-[acyl-carrier-protein] synthase n=1 Tax=Pullulanibacillus pueri TaxID=1437324 RepID=A0A8J3A0N9_9BACL|nr:holo-ACP synthase [Pullulanibacillus pueri]MBM7683802.1 holo-[acyl-carrier protein] synthase [Pullulanibacillus pueri]GGH87640.1 holo-[acyl-carrier-protein] synthase [Pullulanibacillus pueri]